ncbi:MAG: diaminopimelate decarboxylase [Candidatus Omnitrophota bacterium]
MHYFDFKKDSLYCENCRIDGLAKEYATPLYVYSQRTILEHFFKLRDAFSEINPLICYSVKANSNLSLLKLLTANGAGLDIVSGGELYRAKKVKCPSERIVYASVGKTLEEIKEALEYGILLFNAESTPELKRISQAAKELGKKAEIALRFNPNVDPKTHKYITTGKSENKFGMDYGTVKNIFLDRKNYPNLSISGIHMHIGSQITEAAPFIQALKRAKSLIKELEDSKIKIKYLNIGGGLAVLYNKEKPQTASEFAAKVLPLLKGFSASPVSNGVRVILEPGRFIMGNAGILIAKVVYVKDTPKKKFIIVDAAMNDFTRPSLYGAYHKIVPLKLSKSFKKQKIKPADIVGPVCESGDFLGKGRQLAAKEGDYIAVLGAGAYGFSMSSNYNSRPRAAEVLVDGARARLIRKRENYKDLISGEL